ncbi:unnamed protein product [Porites evermanni]|uniref:Uncharacterized protein n=1 Tax=Porites evermanni TaxID=104178 RepID=A0ABN8LSI1_9CNID|nr:unnamed protein product [Porites evermanni]
MAIVFRSLILFLTVLQSFTFGRYPPLPPFLEKNSNGKVCFHDDQMYMPWEKFADKACTGWCTCNGLTGSVGCVSLCPLAPPRKCPPGTEAQIKNVPSGDKTGRCTCKRQVCEKVSVCFHDDEMHMPWEKFADKACTGWCTCNGLTGSVGCVSLCPLAPPRKCPPGTEARIKNVPSGDKTGRCTCKRQVCAPVTVKVLPECVGRASGEYFIDSKCTGRCRCMKGGTGIMCSSLCPPAFVRCSLGEEKEYYDQPMDLDQRCYCKRERCVAKIGAW